MKKIIPLVFLLSVAFGGTTFGQNTAQQNLDNAIQSQENIQQDVPAAKKAVNQLAKQIVFLGNPNAQLFHDSMFAQVSSVQNNADDTDYFVSLAQEASNIPFSAAEITALTAELVNENDILIGLTGQIITALENNNNNVALNLLPQVKNVLNDQNATAATIIEKLEAIKLAIKSYNVCIRTVDNQGNPVAGSDLHGFYAQNNATGEYIYPTNQEGNCFENLAPGTYTFDSFDGYFSGTSSITVTLSDSLVNGNGIIVVDLVYWSE